MILLVHLLLGALIGQKILNPFLAIILAFLSHYFLDLIPHVEYNIKNIKKKQWQVAYPEFLKVFLDFISGVFLIYIFSSNHFAIYACAFFAILPDGLSLFYRSNFHQEKIHFLKNKKISVAWRISSQVIAVIIFLILFKI